MELKTDPELTVVLDIMYLPKYFKNILKIKDSGLFILAET